MSFSVTSEGRVGKRGAAEPDTVRLAELAALVTYGCVLKHDSSGHTN